MPLARFCTCVWLLRALVLRAREVLPLRRVLLLERVLLERVLLERPLLRVELRRFWFVVAIVVRYSSADVRQLKVINSKDNRSVAANTRSETQQRVMWVTQRESETETETGAAREACF